MPSFEWQHCLLPHSSQICAFGLHSQCVLPKPDSCLHFLSIPGCIKTAFPSHTLFQVVEMSPTFISYPSEHRVPEQVRSKREIDTVDCEMLYRFRNLSCDVSNSYQRNVLLLFGWKVRGSSLSMVDMPGKIGSGRLGRTGTRWYPDKVVKINSLQQATDCY